MDSQKPQLKVVDKAIGEEYIVKIPPSFATLTRQRIRAAERDMTYSYKGDTRVCEFVLVSKRTKSKRKRALKRKEQSNEHNSK